MSDKRKRISREPPAQITAQRGRPPMLSSETIVDVALELLRANPKDEFTTAKVARELGVSPPALSRYFPSRAALLEAMADKAFADFPDVPANGNWRDQLTAWQQNMARLLQHNRGMVQLASWEGKLSGPWLKVQMPVISLLHDLGFTGLALFETGGWFLSGTVGMIRTYMAVDSEAEVERSELLDISEGLQKLTPAQRELALEAQKWVGKSDPERVLGIGLRKLVDGIESELKKLRSEKK